VAGENVTAFSTGDRQLRTINYAEVLSFEAVRCQNGVIYLVDNVLFPSGLAPILPTSQPFTPTKNAVDTLIADSRFTTLGLLFVCLTFLLPVQSLTWNLFICLSYSTVSLLNLTGLTGAVNGNGITLIAPTNSAFARLPTSVVNFLTSGTAAAKSVLTSILTYHVITSSVAAADLRDRATLATVQGDKLNVFVEDGTNLAYFNYAQVTQADIRSTNAFIHAIDAVVLPTGVPRAAEHLATSPFASPSFSLPQLIGSQQSLTVTEYVASISNLTTLSTLCDLVLCNLA
jgi:uncharacterized surface protein with fasciclin (FAS1) repeats